MRFYQKKTGIPAGIPVFKRQSRSQSRVQKSIPGPGSRWDPGPNADPWLSLYIKKFHVIFLFIMLRIKVDIVISLFVNEQNVKWPK